MVKKHFILLIFLLSFFGPLLYAQSEEQFDWDKTFESILAVSSNSTLPDGIFPYNWDHDSTYLHRQASYITPDVAHRYGACTSKMIDGNRVFFRDNAFNETEVVDGVVVETDSNGLKCRRFLGDAYLEFSDSTDLIFDLPLTQSLAVVVTKHAIIFIPVGGISLAAGKIISIAGVYFVKIGSKILRYAGVTQKVQWVSNGLPSVFAFVGGIATAIPVFIMVEDEYQESVNAHMENNSYEQNYTLSELLNPDFYLNGGEYFSREVLAGVAAKRIFLDDVSIKAYLRKLDGYFGNKNLVPSSINIQYRLINYPENELSNRYISNETTSFTDFAPYEHYIVETYIDSIPVWLRWSPLTWGVRAREYGMENKVDKPFLYEQLKRTRPSVTVNH
ncbi:hypothetical protein MRY82_04400 [bacterium]|nr:hypothetical protein [bacterium]